MTGELAPELDSVFHGKDLQTTFEWRYHDDGRRMSLEHDWHSDTSCVDIPR